MPKLYKRILNLLVTSFIILSCNHSTQPDTEIKYICPEVKNDLSGLHASETLFLDSTETRQTFIMDLGSKSLKQINTNQGNLEFFAVSPNHSWMFYTSSELGENLNYLSNNFNITNLNKTFELSSPMESNWGNINWLDDERLLINLIQPNEATSFEFIVFNPFTGEKFNLKADYPNIYDTPPLPSWESLGITSFSPQLDQVMYLQGGISGPYYYTLWDIKNKKEITKIEGYGDLSAVPRWQSSGEQIAIAYYLSPKAGTFPSYDLFTVSRDGNILQKTHLSIYYSWNYIADISWSLDGRYIAFWYSYWDEEPQYDTLGNRYLGVFDFATNSTVIYCLHGENDAEIGSRTYQPPIWSPDSRYVVIQSQIGEDYFNFQTILIDIKENTAYYLADNLEPVGWLK